jgi:RNA polymerase sigma factor (sigma-70 family)
MASTHSPAVDSGPRGTVAPIEPGVVSLITGIGAGDTRALALFYEEWFDRAFDLARTLTRRDEAFCLDVVQDAMMKVIHKLRPGLGITTRGSLDAWFARVVHTTAIDQLRREARRRKREVAPADREQRARGDVIPSADELAHLEERINWLTNEVRRLDSQEASLVAMRFGKDRSLEAVGEEHGMTVGATHGRIRRLLDRLRRTGKERFHD